MLEFIQGELLNKGLNSVVVKTGGFAFRLSVPALTVEGLPRLHEEICLYTYLYFREEEFSLYGFQNPEEKELFITLLTISGIGPKLALSILSKYRVSELRRVIVWGDTKALTGIPGVGKKTADRIVLELKDKVGKQEAAEWAQPVAASREMDVRQEAVAGLVALGYSAHEAQNAVPFPGPDQTNVTAGELLRQALKQLAKY
ncbi:MAG: Holliday junction branch migration protein RuvA [Clostridia bacterium]|nr:Holliday junction branch migration protein RuvA [Clostridia bacterium]